MPTAIVTIIIIALIVMGGMTMSQGILSSADAAALSVEEIGVREGEIMRTEVNTIRAAELSWADLLRVRVDNSGQTKLAGFSKWDCIVNYYDNGGSYHTEWLPYTEGTLGDNEWQQAAVWLDGQPEFFEPGIVNPEEELVILAKLSPLPGDATEGEVIIATPNGIWNSFSFTCPGYTLLTPHSENMTLAATDYYELVEAATADGAATTMEAFFRDRETDRKILYDENDSSREARHMFPLKGISQIPADTWTAYYRCRTEGLDNIQDNEVSFDIDIIIRQADGTVRTTLASRVARAYLSRTEVNYWLTKSATYDFPGYTVVDDSDYLEVVYYGELRGNGSSRDGYLQIMIDDDSLDETEQTRIEA